MDIYKTLNEIRDLGGTIYPPVDMQLIRNLELKLETIPSILKDFYQLTNGIEAESFRVLPFYDPNNPKKTWGQYRKG